MKLEKLAPLAELVSSIAIVITLVYLAIQTQQTNTALIANSRQTTVAAEIELINTAIDNPDAVANMTKPMSELSLAEQEQVGNLMAGMIRTREFIWFQYQNGIIDKALTDSYMGTLVRWINTGEATQFYWDLFSPEIDPSFTAYINSRL